MNRLEMAAAVAGAWALGFHGAWCAAAEAPPIPEVPVDRQICFALYTVHHGVLKLTAQFYPLRGGMSRQARLEVRRKGDWVEVSRTKVIEPGWTAPFRVADWDSGRDVPYRVHHGNTAEYEGIIRKDPADKETIVVAAFAGNAIPPGPDGDIPKSDILENIKKLKPDLLFFSGDQVFSHKDHLAHWLKFGRDFGEILRQFPTVCIPGSHDVGQSNLWGSEGRKSSKETGEDGGYFAPADYVNEVQRAQTSHLPDPYDPAPVEQGIGVYYTTLTVGRVSFAIIEDRKFKTGPAGVSQQKGPRPEHITAPDYDPKSLDAPDADLLGERQLRFLREWGADWGDCDMKAVLSQSVLCGGAHLHGSRDHRVYADLDSNGWPPTGRNRALAEIRRAFAVQIAGGQHLAAVFHQGIDEWNDSCYSFGVPPIANDLLCWWDPADPEKKHPEGVPRPSGQFLDGFGNKVSLLAVANPTREPAETGKLTTRASGFGVVRFHKPPREITFECWPRNVDITDKKAQQYAGWPITVKQEDNYIRHAVAQLPTVEIKGIDDPMIQVIDDANGEVICMLRLKGKGAMTFRPQVFRDGPHTIRIGEGAKQKVFAGVMPTGSGGPSKIVADFSPPPPPEPEKAEAKKGRRRS